jgi:hypothetical protein
MRIITESGSVYVVDEDANTVTRETKAREMRRDGEAIEIISMAEPIVGVPWATVLNLRGDGVRTYRCTSPVVEVQP